MGDDDTGAVFRFSFILLFSRPLLTARLLLIASWDCKRRDWVLATAILLREIKSLFIFTAVLTLDTWQV
ncbi:hypothetical protein QBC41DRAFT_327097 [Cercophora samala]|uniref:Uncharacterized protein n=1 Tax=Cercophora samala TaxID=330535 RepID=A0AA40D788_9PEZI|nr:hypothetical protein QBC41DRAFT_327097 [Cercophora samala]